MKKNYLRFALIYCILVLLIFSAVISFYTKNKIDQINAYMNILSSFPDSYMSNDGSAGRESMLKNTAYLWDYLSYMGEDVGFYSSVVDTENNGSVLLESQDFFKVRYYGEIETEIIENSSERYEARQTQLVPGDSRIMILDGPVSLTEDEIFNMRFSPESHDVSITGARCDDTFVFGGTLSFTSDNEVRTLNISKPAIADEAGSIPYEEWVVRIDSLEHYSFGGNSSKNIKAHKVSDAHVSGFLNGKESAGRIVKEGVFTSYSSAIYVFDKGHYVAAYCFVMKPFQIVLRNHLKVYILAILALILVEGVIIFAIRKLYLNQKRFELRSEKLTKGIAYDLQGPLAVTREYLNKWEDSAGDKRTEYSEKIISEVDHMSSMVTRLLELSKMNGCNVKLNREDVDLLLLTKNIKKRNLESILKKDIDLTIECDEDDGAYTVYADLEMMYIVINNFMTNAIKYCDHTVKIRLKKYRNSIEFSITNDGARIDKADLEKVWDVLYSSNKDKTGSDENSGVGLSVVKSILDAHKAKYSCYSGYKGTNFWFTMDSYEDRSFSET